MCDFYKFDHFSGKTRTKIQELDVKYIRGPGRVEYPPGFYFRGAPERHYDSFYYTMVKTANPGESLSKQNIPCDTISTTP